ncbi:DUF4355 domain-containing protein [Senegalia massiliensis]|uniref:DUF4355 domain-containing protein n=1 Tax=Senegalia massiliensis TaxID=1720316 RepID=A0A845R2Q3_9CLOT|nr:DUF4355 domain-containing protein [Senegalia massiliensis]NBI08239.1 DUF4355 domain-containing protein [Senegalia massiliensis]
MLKELEKINLQLFAEEGEEQEEIKKEETKKEQKADESKKEAKYTDEDINKIIDSKFAKWQKQKEEEINEAKKLADMNAQEKAEFERDKIREELKELRKAKTISEMSSTARSMLKEKNISIDDKLLNVLVSDDAEKTKENVESFSDMFSKAVEKAVLDKIKNPNDKKGTTSTVTKEEIMKIKDTTLRQQKIKENMHLFE